VSSSPARRDQTEALRATRLDVLIIGGGINGAGLLRDLALRARVSGESLRAGLIEQAHFGSGTSGKNSHLIHGGLRYLKYLQFHLVRESLCERAILLRVASKFVQPLEFLLPMYGLKSRLLYGTGLWLYDRLAGSQPVARHRSLSAAGVAEIEPGLNRSGLTAGAIFYDGAVRSAPFVVENVLDGIAHGGFAANYARAASWERGVFGDWNVRVEDALSGAQFELRARKLVDARGAWTDRSILRLVRGSHIVIPRVNAGHHAIAHFEPNGRIVFLIPWGSEHQLTLVGTTDEDHQGSPDQVRIAPVEAQYLLGVVKKLYPSEREVNPISAFSSLRPLVRADHRSATSASRDHKIWNSADGVLHIAGGKYTTYRAMAEEAGDLICREIAPALANVHRTAETPFPAVNRSIGDAMEQRLRDYLFVSTTLGYERRWDAESLIPHARALGAKLGWAADRICREISECVKATGLESL